jgi:fructosamine-3-kinase
MEVELQDGRRFAAKINRAAALPLFQEEQAALNALAATKTVIVPQPLAVMTRGDVAVLLMTFIELPASRSRTDSAAMWRNFGGDLAALHMAHLPAELKHGYGFRVDNHIGSSPQHNGWMNDWVAFNQQRRLVPQVAMALERGLLNAGEAAKIERVINGLDCVLPQNPRPSLLHGDLWSGNALPAESRSVPRRTTCAIIDPASYVGDALADIAMMRLFGGFDSACFDAWAQAMRIDLHDANVTRQIRVHQLYHVLNHVNIFGRGYAGQALTLAGELA